MLSRENDAPLRRLRYLVVATIVTSGLLSSIVLYAKSRISVLWAAIPFELSLLVCVLVWSYIERFKVETFNLAANEFGRVLPALKNSPIDLQYNLQSLINEACEQVRESRKKEKSIIEHAVDVICVIDINFSILQVNPSVLSAWGYKPEELIGRKLSEFLDAEYIEDTFQKVIGAERSIDKVYFENRLRRKSGELIDLLWSAHWSASDSGLFCIAHDISARKRVERLLKESEERLRDILEHLPAGVILVNKNGYVEFLNRTAKALSDRASFTPESGLRASEILSFAKEPFQLKQFHEHANSTLPSECQVLCANGQKFPAEVSLNRLNLNSEEGILIVFLDNTDKYEIERVKREFLAMVSHDLNTPLTSLTLILSFIEEGHGGTLTPKGTAMITRAKSEVTRLLELIKDLLDLEKMKSGKFSMNMRETRISELINSAAGAMEKFAEAQSVKIVIPASKEQVCTCDGSRIIQVLINLIHNAIKFSPADSSVTIDMTESLTETTISVSNYGRPIPPDKLTAIFEKFEQVEESDSTVKKGTGLGLAICKTIVEQHGGKIWASSSVEEGTRIAFSLKKPEENIS